MLIRTSLARAAVPFCPYLVHDHWLALYVSAEHEIVFVPESLIDYRIHDKNQTGILSGVNSRADYVNLCLYKPLQAMFGLRIFIKKARKREERSKRYNNGIVRVLIIIMALGLRWYLFGEGGSWENSLLCLI